MVGVTRLSSEEWEAWQAKALAAEKQRQTRLEDARSRRETHAPCPDPFCPWCVPFGRHLDPEIQQCRRQAWTQQDRQRDAARIQRLRAREVEDASGFLHDLALLRKAGGLSQTTLAAKAGITRESLSRIETGKALPRRRVVGRLREVLGGTGRGWSADRPSAGRGAGARRPKRSGGQLDTSSRETSHSGRAERQRQGELAEPLEDHRATRPASASPGGPRTRRCPMPGGGPNDKRGA